MQGIDPSDEQLARSAQSGDREAFFRLYDRYLQRVYNRVRSKVPRQDVEDVTQDGQRAVFEALRLMFFCEVQPLIGHDHFRYGCAPSSRRAASSQLTR